MLSICPILSDCIKIKGCGADLKTSPKLYRDQLTNDGSCFFVKGSKHNL